jgi:hypothetical protein
VKKKRIRQHQRYSTKAGFNCGGKHGELERGRLDKAFLAAVKDPSSSRIFRAYAGADPSAESVSALTTERMLSILVIGSLDSYYMPTFEDVEGGEVADDNPYLRLFGLSVDEFARFYKDIAAEVIENAAKAKSSMDAAAEEEEEETSGGRRRIAGLYFMAI